MCSRESHLEGFHAALPASNGRRNVGLPKEVKGVRMKKVLIVFLATASAVALPIAAASAVAAPEAKAASCAHGTKPAIIAGNFKCLRAGLKCSASYQAQYRKYGFHCANGRLLKGTGTAPTSSAPQAPPEQAIPGALGGHYKGVTSQNETFEFDISSSGWTFFGLKTGQINQGCTPGLSLSGNYLNLPTTYAFVPTTGNFTIDQDLTGWHLGDTPMTEHLTIHGHMNGEVGSGSIELKSAFTYNGVAYTCGSGLQTWTVARVG
jgi:hypothetical protein